jgi:D-amino-acid dehydrogenase
MLMLYKSAAAEEEELKTAEMAQQLGIEAIHLTSEKLAKLEPNIRMETRGAVHYPGDTHLSPDLFMHQMKEHLLAAGVEFLEKQEVVHIEDQENNGCRLSIRNGQVMQARHVVVASGSWSGQLMKKSGYRLPMQDGKGYSMTLQNPALKPTIPAILIEKRVAITPMGDHLRIAGTLEISGMDDRIREHKVKSILDAVPEYYPDLQLQDPGPVWFGYRPCSPDGLPYIGRWKEGSSLLVATGHAMMGLSLAGVTGRMVRDLILHPKDHNLLSKLEPSRFS